MQLVVVIGGGPLDPAAASAVDTDATVIAADSGWDVACAAGLSPAVLVGDLDSISPAGRAAARDRGVEVRSFPADKDATDTDLALAVAAQLAGPAGVDLVVLGGDGDRLDHLLGTIGALGGPHAAAFSTVSAVLGSTRIRIVRPGRPVVARLASRTTFSVLALHGPCEGVRIEGAHWPLDGVSLDAGSTRGISNLSLGTVTISVTSGTLTVVIPCN